MGRGSSGLSGGGGGRQLVPFGTDYDVPFPTGDRADANEIARFSLRLGKYEDVPSVNVGALPVQSIDISKLTRHQDDVRQTTVDSLMKLSISQLNSGSAGGLPWVIKYNDTYQIQDGHHRLTAL